MYFVHLSVQPKLLACAKLVSLCVLAMVSYFPTASSAMAACDGFPRQITGNEILLDENFNADTVGMLPDGWTGDPGSVPFLKVVDTTTTATADGSIQAVIFQDAASPNHLPRLNKSFPSVNALPLKIGFDFRIDGTQQFESVRIGVGNAENSRQIEFRIADSRTGTLLIKGGDGAKNAENAGVAQRGEWGHVEFIITPNPDDLGLSTFDWSVQANLADPGPPITGTGKVFDYSAGLGYFSIEFAATNSPNSAYFDNIRVEVDGATYYVDASNGNNVNDGRSEQQAWNTVERVNCSDFNPGDKVLLKRGESWHEKLVVPSSGEKGKPIVFGAYGNPEDAKPSLTGLVEIAPSVDSSYSYGWESWKTPSGQQLWRTTFYIDPYPNKIDDGLRYLIAVLEMPGEAKTRSKLRKGNANLKNPPSLENRQYFRTNGAKARIYLRLDEGRPGEGGRKFFMARDFLTLLDTNGMSHLVIENISITGAGGQSSIPDGINADESERRKYFDKYPALLLRQADNITVRNCEIAFSGNGIANYESSIPDTVKDRYANNCLIQDNELHGILSSVIYLKRSAQNNRILGNEIHHNYDHGKNGGGDRLAIGLQGKGAADVANNTVKDNYIHHNGVFGVKADGAIALHYVSNNEVIDNRISNNNQKAFYSGLKTKNNKFNDNVVTGNKLLNGRMIFLSGTGAHTATGNTIEKNEVTATTVAINKDNPNQSINSWRLFSIDYGKEGSTVTDNTFKDNVLKSETEYPVRVFVDVRNVESTFIDRNTYSGNISIAPKAKIANLGLFQIGGRNPMSFYEWQQKGKDINSTFDNVLLDENFNADTVGMLPDGWTGDVGNPPFLRVVDTSVIATADGSAQAVVFQDAVSPKPWPRMNISFPSVNALPLKVGFDFRIDGTQQFESVRVGVGSTESSTRRIEFRIADSRTGFLRILGGDGVKDYAGIAQRGEWGHVEIIITPNLNNLSLSTFDWSVQAGSGAPINGTKKMFDYSGGLGYFSMEFAASNSPNSAYFDNIRVEQVDPNL